MQDIVHVPFHGDNILSIETPDGVFIPVLPLCERFGVARQPQQRKIQAASERWSGTMLMLETPAGERETLCLPVTKIAGWLATINPNKVKPEVREALISYQREADMVLDRHFRLRARETASKLDLAEAEALRCRKLALAADPLFNRIARFQEAGVHRRVLPAMLRRGMSETFEVIRSMEKLGLIDRRQWQCEIEDREEQRREAEQAAELAEQAQSPLEAAAAELAVQFPEA